MTIKVNSETWAQIPPEERTKIESIIQVYFKQDIEQDPGVDGPTLPDQEWSIGKAFCETACEVTAATAAAACAALSGGLAIAACLATVKVAESACKDLC
jgi:hypothetical protein